MFTLDASIFVYATQGSDSPHGEAARRLIERSALRAAPPPVVAQVLAESLNVMFRRLHYPRRKALDAAQSWIAVFDVVEPPSTAVPVMLAFLRQYRLSVWDAHLLAACHELDVEHLFSADMSDGERYGNVRVVNPFNPANSALLDAAMNE